MQYKSKIDVNKICSSALSGEEALNTIREDFFIYNKGERSSYNLIFMDCNMPFMDGY